MVSDVLHGHSPGRVHHTQEEFEVDTYCRLGEVFDVSLFSIPTLIIRPRACNSSGSFFLRGLGHRTACN